MEPPLLLADLFDEIVSGTTPNSPCGIELGRSREDRPVAGYRLGAGDMKISLVAGCHADEPVGPLFLNRLVTYLSRAPEDSDILSRFQWWIVPHINPDGAARNRVWYEGNDDRYDLRDYLQNVVRELPGDDIEFGFPRSDDDRNTRSENRAVYEWWKTDAAPFAIHASLHGMAFAGGPWFLIDPDWADRCSIAKKRCRDAVQRFGYKLHDVQRHGEKGFERIERGFCTRPNSVAMARFFVERDDPDTAALFRPSSMETIRAIGGDPLTLVSEMPLFVVPGIGDTIEPNDPVADAWRERVTGWKRRFDTGDSIGLLVDEIAASSVTPVPIRDQMCLQWAFVTAGIEQVLESGSS